MGTPTDDLWFENWADVEAILGGARAIDDLAFATGAMFRRRGVRDEVRREAAALLASADMTSPTRALLNALKGQDRTGADDSVTFDLARLLTDRPAELAHCVRNDRANEDWARHCLDQKSVRHDGSVGIAGAKRWH